MCISVFISCLENQGYTIAVTDTVSPNKNNIVMIALYTDVFPLQNVPLSLTEERLYIRSSKCPVPLHIQNGAAMNSNRQPELLYNTTFTCALAFGGTVNKGVSALVHYTHSRAGRTVYASGQHEAWSH